MGLKIYTESNSSTRRAVRWLNENGVDFQEIRMKNDSLSKQELKTLLSFTDNGLNDLLKRTTKINFDDMTLNQALDFLVHDTSPLRTPILFDGEKLRIGFHEEEIRCFIPHPTRKLARII
ncbi:ArsC/Spx/MgsR family protein [Enterococcus sp. AZ196]|uniref:ArsC/Spx/MgsR family protein n=1 Tax=Enterococcus sp. AZ196 TaxID=2774659 RepID=UPI003D2C9B52